ncbi:MAG TPA: SMI1/KNR4 family protein [Sphingomicrobium sp.]|nr:SMI1/KNR4 family protein [Sphingomicrobium sp.]
MLDGREWFKNEGASEEAISRLSAVAPIPLPASYLTLLQYSNGGEGPLPIDPWNFCLDTAEMAADTEQNGKLKEFFPNLFVVGTSGGGEAIALDANVAPPHPVVQFDMTNCNLAESVHRLAPDFESFLDLVGRSAE